MRINAIVLTILAFLFAGCQPMPPMATDYGAGYAPCVPRAVENGMCLKEGWRRPLPQR